jgi:hypothetical protein
MQGRPQRVFIDRTVLSPPEMSVDDLLEPDERPATALA